VESGIAFHTALSFHTPSSTLSRMFTPLVETHTYVHTWGCRYLSSGRALLLVTPSEREGMLADLQAAKVGN